LRRNLLTLDVELLFALLDARGGVGILTVGRAVANSRAIVTP
jgi:hypothetical protein